MFGQRASILYHFLLVVYPVKRCVDGFVEGAPTLFALVPLYAEAEAVLADGVGAATGAAEAGVGGGGRE